MRELSQHLDQSTQSLVTEPWLLFALDELRLTDGPTTDWHGEVFQRLPGVELRQLQSGPDGMQSGVLLLPNHNGLGTGLLLAAGDQDLPVQIWKVYGPGPHAAADAVLLCDGVLDGGNAEGDWCQLKVTGASEDASQLPRLRVGPPIFNHLPQPGTRIEMGGEVIILESR